MRTPVLWEQVAFPKSYSWWGGELESGLFQSEIFLLIVPLFLFPVHHTHSQALSFPDLEQSECLRPSVCTGGVYKYTKGIGAYINRKLYCSDLWRMFWANSWIKSPPGRWVSTCWGLSCLIGWGRNLEACGALTDESGSLTQLMAEVRGSETQRLPRRSSVLVS